MVAAVAGMGELVAELVSLASAAGAAAPSVTSTGEAAAPGGSFAEFFTKALERLDGQVLSGNAAATKFASGNEDISLSDVMISLEQSNLALQLAANIRDKVAAAYSNVMNMAV